MLTCQWMTVDDRAGRQTVVCMVQFDSVLKVQMVAADMMGSCCSCYEVLHEWLETP